MCPSFCSSVGKLFLVMLAAGALLFVFMSAQEPTPVDDLVLRDATDQLVDPSATARMIDRQDDRAKQTAMTTAIVTGVSVAIFAGRGACCRTRGGCDSTPPSAQT